jgi:hypothetical protein
VFFSYNKKHTSQKTGNKPKTKKTITDLFIYFPMNKTGDKEKPQNNKLKKRTNKNKHSALLVIYSASPSLFSS